MTKVEYALSDPEMNPQGRLDRRMMKEELSRRLDEELSEAEGQVLRMRYGLHDGQTHTRRETEQSLNLTRSRLYTIESRALGKLRLMSKEWPGLRELYLSEEYE